MSPVMFQKVSPGSNSIESGSGLESTGMKQPWKLALFNFWTSSNCRNVTPSQHQIFDEKFDQEPENVRIKMADRAGR